MSTSNYALPNKEYMPYTLISLRQKYPDEEAVSRTDKKREMTQKRNSEEMRANLTTSLI